MRISDWSSDVCSSDLMKSSRMRGVRGGLMAFATMAIAACGGSDNGSGESIGAPKSDRIGHVFMIVPENKNYDRTFGPDTEAPYHGTKMPTQGMLLQNYYATGNASLHKYIPLLIRHQQSTGEGKSVTVT